MSPITAAADLCERCGVPAVRQVALLQPDMAPADHPLCEPCWLLLVAGMARSQPWVKVADPRTIYLDAGVARSLMDTAAADAD